MSTVKVSAEADELNLTSSTPFRAGGEDVLNTAGTYGDISRYLQIFPGVMASSDLSNQMLVRGGHPMENLFLVDGIEVPNINHLADANSTGGFAPMIDAAAIQGLELHTGDFDASYPERLSSVTLFRTLDAAAGRRTELDLGIQGIGGLAQRRVGGGDLLVSAHHGLLNLVSQDAGMNGVPSYSNELTRFSRHTSNGGGLTLLNLAGVDSISISPCATDAEETSTINSSYLGWRETTGVELHQVYSSHAFGTWNASDSEQVEQIHEEDQLIDPFMPAKVRGTCPLPSGFLKTTPVYRENSNNAFSTVKYGFGYGNSRMTVEAGTAAWLQRPIFAVYQPVGTLSPYDAGRMRTDQTAFHSDFATGETGNYAQGSLRLLRNLTLSAGGRMQTFAFGHHMTLTPRLSAGYRLGEHWGLHVSYASYAQMPPYAYLLAYPDNRTLAPMRAVHAVTGMDVGLIPHSAVRLEAYVKRYSAIPASTEYPGVTLHTMVDMFGEQTVWLPMTTGGHGEASGIELSDHTQFGRLTAQGSVAYARARFAGLDGVLHPSNFDMPWVVNAAGVERLGRGITLSGRFGFASGRPYTPFDMAASLAQNRPIYDLTRINVPRSQCYSRVDAQLSKEKRMAKAVVELYMGVDNVLNHENFLSYAWMPRYRTNFADRDPVGTLKQMPIFPNFGVRWIVR